MTLNRHFLIASRHYKVITNAFQLNKCRSLRREYHPNLNRHIGETYSDYKNFERFYILIKKNTMISNKTTDDDICSRDYLKMLSYWYISILIIQIRQPRDHCIFIMGIHRPDESLYWSAAFFPCSTQYSVRSYPGVIFSEHLKYDSPGCSHMGLANGHWFPQTGNSLIKIDTKLKVSSPSLM